MFNDAATTDSYFGADGKDELEVELHLTMNRNKSTPSQTRIEPSTMRRVNYGRSKRTSLTLFCLLVSRLRYTFSTLYHHKAVLIH